ncbi:hypothetical protein FSP39_021414 [Pinctada imbricata]|uniref:Glycosyltransferase 8 domain-containing protein 1 n=1 Tax=Pinctada imbricata TaxID=66713 RepID=A0AA88YUH0_PINIB|nr:hypothetical protein FSP39_021414 [Pinctada imbricata]
MDFTDDVSVFGISAAVLLVVIWIVLMMYLWFPELLPKFLRRRIMPNKGIYRAEALVYQNNGTTEDVIHVCVTSDRSRLGGMLALVNSIHRNTKYPVLFHLIVDEESVQHARNWLEESQLRNIQYELIPFPEEIVEGKIRVRGGRPDLASPLNYARYYLPQLMPTLKGRIIYVDDDCIVQGDIHELYRMKLHPPHLAAFSQDCMGTAKRLTLMKNNYADYIDFKNRHIQDLDFDPNECAFNTGLFVADLNTWRANNITKKLEYWMKLNTKEEVYGNERGGGGSQPPMMIVFYNKYTQIDPNWHIRYLGWTTGTTYTKQFIKHAKLLHWNGRFKPWGGRAQHSDVWEKYFVPDPTKKFKPIRKNV